ncbi:MAG: glycoside hydrolase family 13 protein [Chloroflexi bacterium]|nr:glycoside hydrolase family 13 protein [Chloroflexota bacterium]
MTSPVVTPEWVKDAIFYQIFPDRFAYSNRVSKPANLEAWDTPPTVYGFKGGDLLGVAEHLDYLEDLGITAIYFTPVFQSASNHRYHTHDYHQVDPLLGGNAALRELLDAAHARGIRVVLDGVFNHASRGFFQFNHILECGEQSPYLDWFTVKGFPLQAYDHAEKPNYEAWVGLHALPKLNTNNPQVREFIFEVAERWLHFGIDGWRLDVPFEIKDEAFWQEFRRRVKGVNPEAYIVGEIWHESQPWLQGDQFDAVMNYIQTRACIAFFGAQSVSPLEPGGGYPPLKPTDAPKFAQEIERMLALYDWQITQAQMNLLSSHDTPRFVNMVKDDKSALKLAMLFQMTMPGAPTVYYGDEIGVTGGHDPGCRASFPWVQSRWDTDLHDYVRGAIRLRKWHPALRRGSYRTILAEGELYAFERVYENKRLVVVFNTSHTPAAVQLSVEAAAGQVVFGQGQATLVEGKLSIQAEARNGIVIALEN